MLALTQKDNICNSCKKPSQVLSGGYCEHCLAVRGGTREDIWGLHNELVATEVLTEPQRNTLLNEIMLPYFDKLNVKNRLVFDLLDQPSAMNKTILYLWFQLSRKFEVGIEFPLSDSEITKLAKCSHTHVRNYRDAMEELGILKREGIARAKERGVYAGRKASIDPTQVKQMHQQGHGATEIAKALGIGRASVYRVLETTRK